MEEGVQTKAIPYAKQEGSRLFTLPPELRLMIYEFAFSTIHVEHSSITTSDRYDEQRLNNRKETFQRLRNSLSLLQICQLVRHEALPTYRARLDQNEQNIRDARQKVQRQALVSYEVSDDSVGSDVSDWLKYFRRKLQLILCSLYLAKDLKLVEEMRESVV
ncbi:hypothetical protein M409DRAFT_27970 [Zasmidium cellare ATCC 36951]|uniref:2EXR domain-containing protein n=1 Tax=Zasmidium cellare ATCC 36951 TaxID=1080233 RepID=A0A6A6C3I0_ZASCE|nr:uncharacterized protein M409DRAFT_27970 [Zasmidium cellare ATCC 36951]KAF2161575.1 hypothetical protein M409DRAFT_27970 [Zasmidium cellare ATCC 36951]